MKRALLWLSTLACLALAGLYAYARFNRDPLLVAFGSAVIGMKSEDRKGDQDSSTVYVYEVLPEVFSDLPPRKSSPPT